MSTARTMIRNARNAEQNALAKNLPFVGDDGFRPNPELRYTNPLSALIDDATYELLKEHGVLYEKAIRDLQIRQEYRRIKSGMSSSDAIEKIRESYPYLQFDTIRKIVYARTNREYPPQIVQA